MRELISFILEQKKDKNREYLKWNFVGQIGKKDLKKLSEQIFVKADRTKNG